MEDREYERILNATAVKLSEHFGSVVILATVEKDNEVAMARARNGNVLTCLGHLKMALEDMQIELSGIEFEEAGD